jgi:hypothetical protein
MVRAGPDGVEAAYFVGAPFAGMRQPTRAATTLLEDPNNLRAGSVLAKLVGAKRPDVVLIGRGQASAILNRLGSGRVPLGAGHSRLQGHLEHTLDRRGTRGGLSRFSVL